MLIKMSAEATAAPVEGPRPFTITHDDHRGVVVSVAILFILYACMIIGMRLAARVRTMGVDDWLAVAATVSMDFPIQGTVTDSC